MLHMLKEAPLAGTRDGGQEGRNSTEGQIKGGDRSRLAANSLSRLDLGPLSMSSRGVKTFSPGEPLKVPE